MNIYVANDCSDYHCGSAAVFATIEAEIARKGHTLLRERDRGRIERDVLDACDGVIVNGEGTLHDNRPRARHLIALLAEAQALRKATALINTSWSGMSADCGPVLRRLDQLSVREPLSAAELKACYGAEPVLHVDLSLHHPPPPPRTERQTAMLRTDFYAQEFDCFADPTGGPLARVPGIDLRAMSWPTLLERLSDCRVLLCGRFHGLMAACATRTPFVAFPGNTHKLEGVLDWFGGEMFAAARLTDLPREGRRWPARRDNYAAFFDRVAAGPRWQLAF